MFLLQKLHTKNRKYIYPRIPQIYSDDLKGGINLTVGTQVKQAIAGLKSVQASFEQFALETENKQAKQLYQNAAEQTNAILKSVEPRLSQIEQEEPQYKQQ